MYVNVNLAPPPTETGGPGHTPKTPEILNSLISLTTPSLSAAYANYNTQVAPGDLFSPTSSTASPCEEISSTQFGHGYSASSQMSPSSSDPGGGSCILARVSGVFRGGPASAIVGTPSPPVPELPSPVSSLEATKSALIKEGLKHQIQCKLQAAGKESPTPSDSIMIKEENSDSGEDEERRLRRRERNKIAATKCRNKKKEKTITLMTESESVEDQNIRLKNEIQRLASEKSKLEKLLEDPCHVASCRHSCKESNPPVVVITSPDAPGHLSPPTCGVNRIPESDRVSFCPVTQCGTSYDANTPISSYMNLSPCSLPNVSPNTSQLASNLHDSSPSPSLSDISPSIKASPPITYQQEIFSPLKASHQVVASSRRQHQPYSTTSSRHRHHTTPHQYTQRQSSPYCGAYSNTLLSPSTSTSVEYMPVPPLQKHCYGYESNASLLLASDNFPCDDTGHTKTSSVGKIRTGPTSCGSVRYSPYDAAQRHVGMSHFADPPAIMSANTSSNNAYLNNQFSSPELIDNSQYFPACTYGNI